MNWEAVEHFFWFCGGLLGFEILIIFVLEVIKHPLVRDAERDYEEFMEHFNSILHKGGKV